MSNRNREYLEVQVNRYLDGEVSESEFEEFLANLPEKLDIDSLRTFKSRIDKIEELYRQLEDPDVPAGYWESFADRVIEHLPEVEERTVWQKLLDYVVPARWPKPVLNYAGAIVSVLLIFLIGKTIIDRGDYDLENALIEPHEKQVQILSETAEELSGDEEPIRTETQKDAVYEKLSTIEVQDMKAPAPATKKEIEGDEKGARVEEQVVQEELSEVTTEHQPQVALRSHVVETSKPSGTAVIDRPKKSPVDLTLDDEAAISVPVPTPPEVDIGQSIVVESETVKPDETTVTELKELSLPMPGRRVNGEENEAWEFDSLSATDIERELRLLDSAAAGAPLSGERLKKYASLKSSLALKTRKRLDIDIAVGAIDNVLQHIPEDQHSKWLARKQLLLSIDP